MNKKDCEHLGYLLAQYHPVEPGLREAIFEIDKRIEEEYEGYREVQGETDEILELAEELAESRQGVRWYLKPTDQLKKMWAECMDDARKQVLGENYHPSLFRRR
jgi:sugar-specific transcriptional regulator TrmB